MADLTHKELRSFQTVHHPLARQYVDPVLELLLTLASEVSAELKAKKEMVAIVEPSGRRTDQFSAARSVSNLPISIRYECDQIYYVLRSTWSFGAHRSVHWVIREPNI